MLYRCVNDLTAYCRGGEENIKGLTPVNYPSGAKALTGLGTCRWRADRCPYRKTNTEFQQELDLAHRHKPPAKE